MTLRIIILCAATVLAFAGNTALADDRVAGVYRGVITSAGEIAKGATTLGISNGQIIGAYHFKGLSGIERGTLSRCELNAQQLYCIWKDSFGQGDFLVRFSDDFQGFNGYWFETVGQINATGLVGGNRWDGRR